MLAIATFAFIQSIFKHMFTEAFIDYVIAHPFIQHLTFPLKKWMLQRELEAHPIETNEQLLRFDVKSRLINWKDIIIPLRERGKKRYLGEAYEILDNFGSFNPRDEIRKVLVCHDMMGNYREDKYYDSSKKWDDYRFYHWSIVDYFCYFSHKYVTIPPCSWINAAHTHGVPILGTFIVEGRQGIRLLREVLHTRKNIEDTVEALVGLCKHFCFDGWFVNIEHATNPSEVPELEYFVDFLRRRVNDIPNGTVFWYDSITNTGQLSWQNELNEKNMNFFEVSDAILLNYTWKEQQVNNTIQNVYKKRKNPEQVYFGIDIFGRGQIAKFKTRQTLASIPPGFSVGFFAPGWTHETLSEYGYEIHNPKGNDSLNEAFLSRDAKFWNQVWTHFGVYAYRTLPFYTDFCLGSGKYTFIMGVKFEEEFFNLSRQSPQPSISTYTFAHHNYNRGVSGGSCLEVRVSNRELRLFVTEFKISKTLIFAYAFQFESDDDDNSDVDCILKLSKDNDGNNQVSRIGENNFNYNNNYCALICGSEGYANYSHGKILLSPVEWSDFLQISEAIKLKENEINLPYNLGNEWTVRYYWIRFSQPVLVQDIGIMYRKTSQRSGRSLYLGSIYVNDVDVRDCQTCAEIDVDRYFV